MHDKHLRTLRNFYRIFCMSGYRDEYTPESLRLVANRFRLLAATIDGIADAVAESELKSVSLKLGTATGTLFDRIEENVETADFDAGRQIQVAKRATASKVMKDAIEREKARKRKG